MRCSLKIFWIIIICLCQLGFFESKGQKVLQIDSSNVQKLRFDPESATGGTATEIFESATYIPLETTKESLFGKIAQLEVTEKYFIILDKSTNAILFFHKDGKYSHKIKGGNPDLGAPNFDKLIINRFSNEIVHFQSNSKGLFYVFLDFNGKKTREIKHDFSTDLTFYDYKFISKDEFISSTPNHDVDVKGKQTKYQLTYIRGYHDVYASAFPYQASSYRHRMTNFDVNNFTYAGTDTAFLYTKPDSYDIYSVSKNSIALKYQFILPLPYVIPLALLKDSVLSDDVKMQRIRDGRYLFRMGEFYLLGNNLAFHLYTNRNQGLEDDLIYNLKTGTLTAYNHILTDKSTFFLPIIEQKFGKSGFLNADSNYVYSQFSSLEMFNAYKENKNKNMVYTPVLSRYFSTESNYSNPVLLQVSFKQ
jgi:hypothetical protein